MEEDGDDDMPDLESLNYDDLDSVSKLQKTQRYNDIMQVCNQSHTNFLKHAFLFCIYIL
jgi:U4/U6 small nuclear ribonucleoprotein PRP31